MSRLEKIIKRLKSNPKDLTWDELSRLLIGLGFEELDGGKTSGSRRKFYHSATSIMINLHKPHPSNINQVLYH